MRRGLRANLRSVGTVRVESPLLVGLDAESIEKSSSSSGVGSGEGEGRVTLMATLKQGCLCGRGEISISIMS